MMARTTPQERIAAARKACRPAAELGAALLDLYIARIPVSDSPAAAEQDVLYVRELCRIVEANPFTELSVEALEAAAERDAPSKTALCRRRQVVGRVLRLLEQDGLPPRRDRTISRNLEQELSRLPRDEQSVIRRWLAYRHDQGVGWHELLYEARRIADLERLRREVGSAVADEDTIGLWIRRTVHPVVACDCPPVTRRHDPLHCCSCNASVVTHGTRPSPGPKKRRELRATGRRYLDFRRNIATKETDEHIQHGGAPPPTRPHQPVARLVREPRDAEAA